MIRQTMAYLLILSFSLPLSASSKPESSEIEKDEFSIKVIYNNTGTCPELHQAWGYALWIENEKEAILFDTGGDSTAIWDNIRKLKLNTEKLSAIVISHSHWDHINGLPIVLEKTNKKIPVYVPEGDFSVSKSKCPGGDLRPVTEAIEIGKNIWSTGQLSRDFGNTVMYEHSLMLLSKSKVYVLTGCAHTQIVKIVKQVKKIRPKDQIQLVTGGFHLMRQTEAQIKEISDNLKKLGVKTIGPSHCTGDGAIKIFKQEWGKNFINLNLGDSYKI